MISAGQERYCTVRFWCIQYFSNVLTFRYIKHLFIFQKRASDGGSGKFLCFMACENA